MRYYAIVLLIVALIATLGLDAFNPQLVLEACREHLDVIGLSVLFGLTVWYILTNPTRGKRYQSMSTQSDNLLFSSAPGVEEKAAPVPTLKQSLENFYDRRESYTSGR